MTCHPHTHPTKVMVLGPGLHCCLWLTFPWPRCHKCVLCQVSGRGSQHGCQRNPVMHETPFKILHKHPLPLSMLLKLHHRALQHIVLSLLLATSLCPTRPTVILRARRVSASHSNYIFQYFQRCTGPGMEPLSDFSFGCMVVGLPHPGRKQKPACVWAG